MKACVCMPACVSLYCRHIIAPTGHAYLLEGQVLQVLALDLVVQVVHVGSVVLAPMELKGGLHAGGITEDEKLGERGKRSGGRTQARWHLRGQRLQHFWPPLPCVGAATCTVQEFSFYSRS